MIPVWHLSQSGVSYVAAKLQTAQSDYTGRKIAAGSGIDELRVLNRKYGKGHWRKLKGVARVQLDDGTIHLAEIHFYRVEKERVDV